MSFFFGFAIQPEGARRLLVAAFYVVAVVAVVVVAVVVGGNANFFLLIGRGDSLGARSLGTDKKCQDDFRVDFRVDFQVDSAETAQPTFDVRCQRPPFSKKKTNKKKRRAREEPCTRSHS